MGNGKERAAFGIAHTDGDNSKARIELTPRFRRSYNEGNDQG